MRGIKVFFIKNLRIISIVELKECVASASILGIVVDKLYYKKKSCLIILLKINKSLEIGFYYASLSFSLTIHL